MKKNPLFITLLFITLLLSAPVYAQSEKAVHIENSVQQSEIEFNIYFLASDEFLGRDTGTQELQIASRYISTWYQINGIQKAPGYDSYFQEVPFQRLKAPEAITFDAGDSTYVKNRHLISINEARGDIEGEIIFLEYASEEEIAEHDVEGKIVVAATGLAGQTSPQQYFSASAQKRQWVSNAGGEALIELYSNRQFPWQVLVNFLGGDRLDLDDNSNGNGFSSIPHLWMNAVQNNAASYLEEISGEKGSLSIEGEAPEKFTSRNVIGVIEGTDADLKDEYILLSAHYDHVGVNPNHPDPITSEYIYNGARDNAVGTAGILAAGKYFAENPPRRSVILAAWTAEEKGLLGSGYFADHPMIPLNQIIYNLNIDGAGYNDTTKVTVIGLGRTEADEEMIKAAESFSLEAIPDPVPEQNLFDRSDNVNFARNGIPAPTYSMGLTAFDDEINYYYHQVTDEPDTVNYEYITQYIRSYVLAALKIANRDEPPFWLPGDVYEEAGKELYGRE